MYDSDRVNLTDCQKLSYRRSVESLTGNGHESKVYRIEWITSSRAIRIQLIGGDEISQEDFDAMEKAWSDYIASFQDMSVDRTLGLENFKLNPPFLNRNIKLVKKSTQDKLVTTKEENDFKEGNFIAETGLAIRICMRSYRMFFHPNTTEFLMRKKKKQISNKSTTSG
ncbi:Transcriptional regulatory protein sin3 [Puccinia graminis f. sp. tritici]|nr:Transcriptional regulatory protein sin3 [Puccinia graminis f. sp. tritici]